MIINEQKKIEYQGTTVWRYRLDNCIPIIADIIYSSMAKQMDKMAEKQQRKFVFCIGGEVRGMAWIKMYDVSDYADYYRAGGLKVVKRAGQCKNAPPPYLIEPPDMAIIPEDSFFFYYSIDVWRKDTGKGITFTHCYSPCLLHLLIKKPCLIPISKELQGFFCVMLFSSIPYH